MSYNKDIEAKILRNANQRFSRMEQQFYTSGTSLKNIVRGVSLNSQMIDTIRKDPSSGLENIDLDGVNGIITLFNTSNEAKTQIAPQTYTLFGTDTNTGIQIDGSDPLNLRIWDKNFGLGTEQQLFSINPGLSTSFVPFKANSTSQFVDSVTLNSDLTITNTTGTLQQRLSNTTQNFYKSSDSDILMQIEGDASSGDSLYIRRLNTGLSQSTNLLQVEYGDDSIETRIVRANYNAIVEDKLTIGDSTLDTTYDLYVNGTANIADNVTLDHQLTLLSTATSGGTPDVIISGASTSPNGGRLAFGDGTGWKFVIGSPINDYIAILEQGGASTNATVTISGDVFANSYTPFTGSHIGSYGDSDNLTPGMVMAVESATLIDINQTDVVLKIAEAKDIPFGVYVKTIDNTSSCFVNALGEGGALVTKQDGISIMKGDYLIVSSQKPGMLTRKTTQTPGKNVVAKSLDNVTWEQGETEKLVPVVYMCG